MRYEKQALTEAAVSEDRLQTLVGAQLLSILCSANAKLQLCWGPYPNPSACTDVVMLVYWCCAHSAGAPYC